MRIYRCFSEGSDDLAERVYQLRDTGVDRVAEFKTVEPDVRQLLVLSLNFYSFELANSTEADAGEERRLGEQLGRWCGLGRLRANREVWGTVRGSLLLFAGALELELRRMVVGGKLVGPQELDELERATQEMAQAFWAAHSYCQKVTTILTHLRIYWLNMQARQGERLVGLIGMVVADHRNKPQLLTLDTRITLLYNCLKTLLGAKELEGRQA